MTALVIALSVIALVCAVVLGNILLKLRRVTINSGLDVDVIDPNDKMRLIVRGSLAGRWLFVAFIVAVAGLTPFLAVLSSLSDDWKLFLVVFSQLFAWSFAVALQRETVRARSEHEHYQKLVSNWSAA